MYNMQVIYKEVPVIGASDDFEKEFCHVDNREAAIFKLNQSATSKLLGTDSVRLMEGIHFDNPSSHTEMNAVFEAQQYLVDLFGEAVMHETPMWDKDGWHVDEAGPVVHVQGMVYGAKQRVATFTHVKTDYEGKPYCADLPPKDVMIDGVVYRCTTEPGEALCFYGEGLWTPSHDNFLAHYFSGAGTWVALDSSVT